MTIRQKFIRDWGKETYDTLVSSAKDHADGENNKRVGDFTKWAILIAIGYECMELKHYRDYHGFKKLNWLKMKKWIKDNAELTTYKGDYDYLAALTGAYDFFIKKEQK